MSKFQHSLGNKKINFLKSLSFIFSKLALDFIGLFFKLDKKKVAVEYNGTIISKIAFKKKFLKEKDKIEIVHFIGGG